MGELCEKAFPQHFHPPNCSLIKHCSAQSPPARWQKQILTTGECPFHFPSLLQDIQTSNLNVHGQKRGLQRRGCQSRVSKQAHRATISIPTMLLYPLEGNFIFYMALLSPQEMLLGIVSLPQSRVMEYISPSGERICS